MKLYTYWRSSAAYRVRIALHLKGLECEQVAVDLRAGAQRAGDYLALNPQGAVPVLELDDGTRLTQSLAICEYLEERYPAPALLPHDAPGRARVRALALAVACDIHPLNNLRVLGDLEQLFGIDPGGRKRWYRLHVERGLRALEALIDAHPHSGRFCHGDAPTLADLCLVPQLYNARRFDCDLSACPKLVAIDEHCQALEPFARAAPERQPDAG